MARQPMTEWRLINEAEVISGKTVCLTLLGRESHEACPALYCPTEQEPPLGDVISRMWVNRMAGTGYGLGSSSMRPLRMARIAAWVRS